MNIIKKAKNYFWEMYFATKEIQELSNNNSKNIQDISNRLDESQKNIWDVSNRLDESQKNIWDVSIRLDELQKNIWDVSNHLNELQENMMKACDKEKAENVAPAMRSEEFQIRLQEGASRLEKAGSIGKEHLEGCIVLADRKDALKLIPQNGIVAEVGVAYGDFSEKIIAECKPTKFYAIDYFSQDNPYCNFWGRDLFRKDNMPHQEWYEHRFRSLISKGQVVTKQGFSWDVLSEFEDDYFDYVYLDAAHDYESVKKDISVLIHKVKDGGYIQFNDYTVFSILEDSFYGVVPAVNEFINEKGSKHKVVAICLQQNGYFDLLLQLFK